MKNPTQTSMSLKRALAKLLISLRHGPKRFMKALDRTLPLMEHLADFKMLHEICNNLGERFSGARLKVAEAWEKASWMALVKLELHRPRCARIEWVRKHQFAYVVIEQLSHAQSAVAAGIRALLGELQGLKSAVR